MRRNGAIDPRRGLWEACAAAVLLALSYLVLRTAPALAAGAFSDDGVYLALGKALADGEGYRSLYAVGDPVHMKYPPGLPAIYAMLWALRSDLAFVHSTAMLLSLLATALTAGLLWWLARTRFHLHAAPAAALVLGPFLLEGAIQYFNLPISEPWFMLGWALCLTLFPRALEGAPAWAVLVGLTAAATTLVRTQAVVLIAALVLAALLLHRGWRRPLLVGVAGLLPLFAWKVWHGAQAAAGPLTTQPDEATYTSWAPETVGAALTFLLEILRSQANRYWTVLPPNLAPWHWLGALISLGVVVGLAAGAVRRFRDSPATVISVLALAGVISVWPYSQDRFVLALLPFVGLLTAAGLQWLFRTRAPGHSPMPGRVLLGILALVVLIVTVRQAQIRGLAVAERTTDTFYFHPAQFLPDNSQFVIAASRWIRTRAQPDDRLLTPLSSALWLYTGRKGVNSTPAEPNIGASVFDTPGRFLATRVLEDDVTLLFLWNPNFLITRDGATVQGECPEALDFLEMTEGPASVAIFRINRDDPCLVSRFLDPAR